MLRQDWDPRSEAVLRDRRAACDEMRERCPVACSDFLATFARGPDWLVWRCGWPSRSCSR